jgi:hypothetical protein
MAEQMIARGLMKTMVPPIWSWHSCGAIGKPPDQGRIRSLFPMGSARNVLIALEVPKHLALLSYYGDWFELVFARSNATSSSATVALPKAERMFDVKLNKRKPWGEANSFDIQASLPYLSRSWVKRILPVEQGAETRRSRRKT